MSSGDGNWMRPGRVIRVAAKTMHRLGVSAINFGKASGEVSPVICKNAVRLCGRVPRRVVLGLTLCLALVAGTGSARADLVTFTLTGPNLQGTLNGVAFNAPFTITATADPAGMSWGLYDEGGPMPSGALAATSTMTIDGVGTFDFTDSRFGPFQIDLSSLSPGFFLGGFGFFEVGGTLRGFFAQGTATGDQLVNEGFGVEQGFTFATTMGDLIINTNTLGTSSYSYLISSPVPEPSTWALGLIAAALTGVSWRRSRRTPA